MKRYGWRSKAAVAVALPMVLMAAEPGPTPAAARELGADQVELVDRLAAEGLTRAEMVGLYESLAPDAFTPPACVPGAEMFTDVPASAPFCPWVEELARRGITGGCSADQFCPGNPVTRAQMAVFLVGATADEPHRVVGDPGEPMFLDGGDGDCLWQNVPPGAYPRAHPTSFYMDSDGVVHLAGFPFAFDGPAGDATCGVANDWSDAVIFRLPPGYRTDFLQIFPSVNSQLGAVGIAPRGGVILAGNLIPGGSVFVFNVEDANGTSLDGISFRAAELLPATIAPEPEELSLEALRALLGPAAPATVAVGDR